MQISRVQSCIPALHSCKNSWSMSQHAKLTRVLFHYFCPSIHTSSGWGLESSASKWGFQFISTYPLSPIYELKSFTVTSCIVTSALRRMKFLQSAKLTHTGLWLHYIHSRVASTLKVPWLRVVHAWVWCCGSLRAFIGLPTFQDRYLHRSLRIILHLRVFNLSSSSS